MLLYDPVRFVVQRETALSTGPVGMERAMHIAQCIHTFVEESVGRERNK